VNKSKKRRTRVGPDGLTNNERQFVHAYSQTLTETNGKGNQTRAALLCGATETNASNLGYQMMKLPQVKSAIAVLMDERCKKFDITSERILQEIAALGFANMKDYLTFGENGEVNVDWTKLTEEQAKAIAEVTIETYPERTGKSDEDGKPVFEEVKRIRFKLHDKKGSLELLGRHHKLFTDNVAHVNPDGSAMAQATSIKIELVDAKDGREA
jgi:phage terminase small subunit